MSRFRLNCKRLFLTYPQCEYDKNQCLANIQAHFGDLLESAVVCAEHHAATEQDPVGGPHLHAMILLNKQVNYVAAGCLDHLAGKHGDYRSMKGSVKQSVTYLIKEDKEPAVFGLDIEALMKSKTSAYDEMALKIKSMENLEDAITELDELFPGRVLNHKRKLEEYIDFQKVKRAKVATLVKGVININGHEVEVGMPRVHRQTQWYIEGPRGVGKTSIIIKLREAGFRGYQIPYDDHWEDWSDDLYDFAYADEFHGQVKITQMNNFLDGAEFTGPCRYHRVVKKKNVPVFILSNLPLMEQYSKMPAAIREAFFHRLTPISLSTYPTITILLRANGAEIGDVPIPTVISQDQDLN